MFGQICIWLVLILVGYLISNYIWRHQLNPLRIGVIVWTPGIILATCPHEFLSPHYYHLNHSIGFRIYIALILGYLGFMSGVIIALAVVGRALRRQANVATRLQVDDWRLLFLFIIGLSTFAFLYINSGLTNMLNLDHNEIFKSRLNLHQGPISFLTFIMDIVGIIYFARWLESRKIIFLIPYLIATSCQMATLQKSRTLLLLVGAVYLCMVKPLQAKVLLLGSRIRFFITIGVATVSVSALFVMNSLRGIGLQQLTGFESPIFEQIYLYSGAAAILNLSSTIEGFVFSDEPKYGLLLLRPITWHLVDRDFLNANMYLEGINAATYLIYAWADFRWIGFLATSFMTGLLITSYILLSLGNTVHGIIFGIVALNAVLFSVNTDVIFDPTTPIILVCGLFVSLATKHKVSNSFHSVK